MSRADGSELPGCGGAGAGEETFDCREVFLRFDDYVDRALSPEDLAQIENHIEVCGPCAQELGFTTGMIEEMKVRLRQIRAPDALRARLAQMFTHQP